MALIRPGLQPVQRQAQVKEQQQKDASPLPVVMAGAKQVVDIGQMIQKSTAQTIKNKGFFAKGNPYRVEQYDNITNTTIPRNIIKTKEGTNMFTTWDKSIEIDDTIPGGRRAGLKVLKKLEGTENALSKAEKNALDIKIDKNDNWSSTIDETGGEIVGEGGETVASGDFDFDLDKKFNLDDMPYSDPLASTDDSQSWYDAAQTYQTDAERKAAVEGGDVITGNEDPLPFEIASGDEDFSLSDYIEPDASIDESVDKLTNVTQKVTGDASNVLTNVAPDASKYANLPQGGKFMGDKFFTQTTGGAEGASGPLMQMINAGKLAASQGTLGTGGMMANMGIGTGAGTASATGATNALSGLLTNPAGLLAGMTPFGWAMMGLSVLSILNEKFDWF